MNEGQEGTYNGSETAHKVVFTREGRNGLDISRCLLKDSVCLSCFLGGDAFK